MKMGLRQFSLYVLLGLATACGSTGTGSVGADGTGNLSSGEFTYTVGGSATGEEAGSGSYGDEGEVDASDSGSGSYSITGGSEVPVGGGTASYGSNPIDDYSGAVSIYVNPGKCETGDTSAKNAAALVSADAGIEDLDSSLRALMSEDVSGVKAITRAASGKASFSAEPGSAMRDDDDDPVYVIVANLTRGSSKKIMANRDGSFENLEIEANTGDILALGRVSKSWVAGQALDGTTIFRAGSTGTSSCQVPMEGSDEDDFANEKAFNGLDLSDID